MRWFPSDRSRRINLAGPVPVLRSDNGLVFGAKVFVKVARRDGVQQEYITPYTPQQNGMIERFFLTVKQEFIWLYRFESRDHAFRIVGEWLDRYDAERPHSALGYQTPKEYREKLAACGVRKRGGHHRTGMRHTSYLGSQASDSR